MSQRDRTKKHKEAHPRDEAIRKERQRAREGVFRFHIRRFELYGIKIPQSIDQQDQAFNRVYDEYMKTCMECVELVEGKF